MSLRTKGGGLYGTAAEYSHTYPEAAITIRRKSDNVAGLQIADLMAASQKLEIVASRGGPLGAPPSPFTSRLNAAAAHMINQYGQYLLD